MFYIFHSLRCVKLLCRRSINAINRSLISINTTIHISRSIELFLGVFNPIFAEILGLVVRSYLYKASASKIRTYRVFDTTYCTTALALNAMRITKSPSCFGLDLFVWCYVDSDPLASNSMNQLPCCIFQRLPNGFGEK